MVPPVLVDVNRDGVKDILMSAYDGSLVLFDGESFDEIWVKSFKGYEWYRCAISMSTFLFLNYLS